MKLEAIFPRISWAQILKETEAWVAEGKKIKRLATSSMLSFYLKKHCSMTYF